jgi:hypothetical protein
MTGGEKHMKKEMSGCQIKSLITLILAASFYCTPNADDTYTCKKVDFEIREFMGEDYKCVETKDSDLWQVWPKCSGWGCTPFDKGAIILERQDSTKTWKDPSFYQINNSNF